MDFCPDASSTPTSRRAAGPATLAALGVLSHEPRLRLRNAVRATWFPDLPPTIVARFVLRGLALQEPNATQAEAARHGDVLFVRARSVMLRENGPLQSLVLWFECARRRFASARFIGKADDDVWIRPSGWATLLTAVRGHVPEGAHAYVGAMEGYHWRMDADAPVDWLHFPLARQCKRKGKAGGQVGPFAFGKGASFFMTAHTAARVAGHAAHVRRITETDAARCFAGSQLWYEANCCGASEAAGAPRPPLSLPQQEGQALPRRAPRVKPLPQGRGRGQPSLGGRVDWVRPEPDDRARPAVLSQRTRRTLP